MKITYMTKADIPIGFTQPMNDLKLRTNYVWSLKVDPAGSNDKDFGVAWVYCSRHQNVHSTGWCSYLNVFKQPLNSPHFGLATEEWVELQNTWKEYGLYGN